MNEESPTERSPKRRLQFRLRTLLIAVLVLSLPLSWFAVRMERARRQREAVEAIELLGGFVLYDWQLTPPPTGMTVQQAKPYPLWTRRLIGDDFFDEVLVVSLAPSDEVPPPDLNNLRVPDPPSSEEHRRVGDSDLNVLAVLKHVQLLILSHTHVSDEGLKCLHAMANLEVVFLEDTHVTPEGVKKLQEVLPNCKIVY